MAAWGIDIRWLVTDQLGTPRMVFDQSGSLAGVSRHDYLPFGEEIYAGIGSRTTTQGFNIGDGARQKFTGYERDSETGLDFAQARYDSSTQGRFTSPDPYSGSMSAANPQSFNRYAYVGNNPMNATDPTGLSTIGADGAPGGFISADDGALGRVGAGKGLDPSLGTEDYFLLVYDWWSQLSSNQQILLTPKLTRVKDSAHPTTKELGAARTVFNSKVEVRLTYQGRDYGQDYPRSMARVLTIQNFVRDLGDDMQVWAQIKSIGDIRDSEIEITVGDGFVSALQATGRFSYFRNEPVTCHENSFRELGRNVSDPSMHLTSDGHSPGGFGVHWDPSSPFTETSWSEFAKDRFIPERRVIAALKHWREGHAAPTVVAEYMSARRK